MKQRVLVVDDDPTVRVAHARFVELLGYEAETAADGFEAMSKLVLGIDLILLDIHMPGIDGFEVAARIRRDSTHRFIPIIMITGADRAAWYPRALEVGANDVMAKPIDANELRLRTRWLMDLKAAHDEIRDANVRLSEGIARATADLRRALEEMTEARRLTYQAHLDTINRLTLATEFRGGLSAGHLARFAHCAAILGRAAGLSPGQVDTLHHAAPLHDVGMVAVPEYVLMKAGPLDSVERAWVREHPSIGASLLVGSASEVIRLGATIALRHHERWDGGGYPDGLTGEEIPVEARICAIVDTFDASTVSRPYRRALGTDEAIEYMRAQVGHRFDPDLFDAFLGCLPEVFEVRKEYPVGAGRAPFQPTT